ncbi:unnamed protein product, partial [marine sediment metagenome]
MDEKQNFQSSEDSDSQQTQVALSVQEPIRRKNNKLLMKGVFIFFVLSLSVIGIWFYTFYSDIKESAKPCKDKTRYISFSGAIENRKSVCILDLYGQNFSE